MVGAASEGVLVDVKREAGEDVDEERGSNDGAPLRRAQEGGRRGAKNA